MKRLGLLFFASLNFVVLANCSGSNNNGSSNTVSAANGYYISNGICYQPGGAVSPSQASCNGTLSTSASGVITQYCGSAYPFQLCPSGPGNGCYPIHCSLRSNDCVGLPNLYNVYNQQVNCQYYPYY